MPRPGDPVRRGFWLGAAIAIAAGICYANTFRVPFLYDDVPSIPANATIRHLWPLGPVLSPPGGGLTVEGRPLLNLSFAANYAVGGLRVGGYHAANLLIHLCAGLACFGLARRILERGPRSGRAGAELRPALLAFAIALLWTVHPLQTEAVTYIVQRAESLMSLCYLLTLYCFVRCSSPTSSGCLRSGTPQAFREHPQGQPESPGGFRYAIHLMRWDWLCVLFCWLGMAAKEDMVAAPLMVLLLDRTFFAGTFAAAWRRSRRLYLALAASWILLACLVATTGGNRGGSAGFDVGVSWGAYWLTQIPAVAHYLRLAIWPHPLVFDYGPEWVGTVAQVLPAAGLIALLVAGTAVALRRWPAMGFLGAWFFALLAPTSLVPGPTQMIAEHRMYLALAPVLAALVCCADRLWSRTRRDPRWLLGALIAGAIGLGGLTVRRNTRYATALALWSDTAAKRPDNPVANRGVAYELAQLPGRLPEAADYYERALRFRPDVPETQNNLGAALAKLPGRLPEAVAHYEAALELKPDYVEAHFNLGNALLRLPGGRAAAVAQFEAALSFRPDFADAHRILAHALAEMPGRLSEAAFHYEQVLRIDPGNAEARNNLAVIYAQTGRRDEAIGALEAELRINPGDARARENLATLRARR